MTLKELQFPRMFRVRQKFEVPPPVEPRAAVDETFSPLADELSRLKGKRVAVGVGSRGIDGIVPVVKRVVERLKAAGADVFIIPAMGSHGGATVAGQIEVLAHRGITEESVCCTITGTMETVPLGETSDGIPLFVNRLANEADALCLINRVKPHTNFIGATGSGILKMAAIGLGNEVGATHYHNLSMVQDQYQIISSAGREIIARKGQVIGLAIVENQRHQACSIEAAFGEAIEPMETGMLSRARDYMPGLPMDDIDLLIVDEMGKNISGQGIDPNVVGRDCCSYGARRDKPRITRIFVRDLTESSVGSALGIGQADFCLRRLVDKIDPAATYVNCLTACCPEAARVPMTYTTDLEAIGAALTTIRPYAKKDLGVVRIKNTMDLETILVSEAYLEEMQCLDTIDIVGESNELEIDARGMMKEIP
jgi:hypothetical protein